MAMPKPPDPEGIAVAWALARSSITDIADDRVGTDLAPGESPSIRVTTVGSNVPQFHEFHPLLEFECWGGTREQAQDLAGALVSEMSSIYGAHALGFVSSWEITIGPFYRDDPVSNRPRFIVDVQLVTHALTP